MTKPLSKREKARRARDRRWDNDFDKALNGLVTAGMLKALAVTCQGIQGGNPEMTRDEVFELARDIVGTHYVIGRAIDAALSTMGEEIPGADEAVKITADAAEKAALETFTLRHKLPMGRA